MKSFPILLISCILGFSSHIVAHEGSTILDSVSINVEDNQVVLTDRNNAENFITISTSYELTIRDNPVKTNKKQKKLLEEYYLIVLDIDRTGEQLAEKAKELGSKANRIALYALLQLAESFTDRDYIEGDDDIHLDNIDGELGDDLKILGEDLEKLIKKLEATHKNLKTKISPLDDLDWF